MINTQTTVELGQSYRDSVTGFSGQATARTEHITGRVNITLERWNSEKEKIDGYIFEEERLEAA